MKIKVWDFILFENYTKLMSFSTDNELRIWNLKEKEMKDIKILKREKPEELKVVPIECEYMGSIKSESNKRTIKTKVIKNYILQLVN